MSTMLTGFYSRFFLFKQKKFKREKKDWTLYNIWNSPTFQKLFTPRHSKSIIFYCNV